MTFLREVGRDGGSPAKRSWVQAEPHFSKFGPPGGRTLADLLRPQTHDLFAEGRPGRTLADLLGAQTHRSMLGQPSGMSGKIASDPPAGSGSP